MAELVAAITRYRGDTGMDQFILTDEDGAVVDITTGYSFIFTLNRDENPIDNTDRIYALTGAVVDGPNGVFGFTPTAEQADQDPAFYWYDVQVTGPSNIDTVEKDVYRYVQDITK